MIKTSDFKDIKKMKKQATMGENLCKKKKNVEELISRIQKELLKLNKKQF